MIRDAAVITAECLRRLANVLDPCDGIEGIVILALPDLSVAEYRNRVAAIAARQ